MEKLTIYKKYNNCEINISIQKKVLGLFNNFIKISRINNKTLLVYIINRTAPILAILKLNLKLLDFTIFKLFSEKVVVIKDRNI